MRVQAIVFALLVSCGQPVAQAPPDDDRGPAATLQLLSVLPSDSLLETSPGAPAVLQFQALGVDTSGVEVEVPLVEWEVSNRSAGTITPEGLFTSSDTNGGITWVTARLGELEGLADVAIRFVQEIPHPDVDPGLFDGPSTEMTGSWTYPEDGVNIPRNTPSIHFQWLDLAADAYKVTFSSPLTELIFYTPTNDLVVDVQTWTTIASTNAGGSVAVTLEASSGGNLTAEPPISVEVNRLDADGSVFYWSTTAAGFIEVPYGGVAQDYLTQAQTGRCLGCHAISNTGLIAYSWDGGDGALGVRVMSNGSEILTDGYIGNFKTFSPDGLFLVATDHGVLNLHDGMTGALIGPIPGTGPATHPDWSPDGSALVYTQTDGHTSDWVCASMSRVMVMDHLGGGVFDVPRVLAPELPPWRAYYPAWSPDSEWVAFNRSTGDCYDDPDAEVWAVHRSGQPDPVRLDLANALGVATNSWPRWGPLPDDEVLWLTFGSRRNYGNLTFGAPQIWVAAFDPARALDGEDPSWPAFWLPGQDIATGNHTPIWTR